VGGQLLANAEKVLEIFWETPKELWRAYMTTLKRNSIGHTLGNAQIKREDPLCAFPSASPDVLMRFVQKKNPPVNIL
jgi:hypothetical protein